MITKDDILNAVIDVTAEQSYLDIDNDKIEKLATAIYQRIVGNDTQFFGLPFEDTVAAHNITDKQIRRTINMAVNVSKLSMGDMSLKEFVAVKLDWYLSLFRMTVDDPKHIYNALKNIKEMFEEENLDFLETGLLNSIYENDTLREALNESLLSRAIIYDDKDKKFYEDVKNTLPLLYLYWCGLFFMDNNNYLTDTLMKKILEKVNRRDLDVSYFYEMFSNLDEEIDDDFDEITEEEVEMLI